MECPRNVLTVSWLCLTGSVLHAHSACAHSSRSQTVTGERLYNVLVVLKSDRRRSLDCLGLVWIKPLFAKPISATPPLRGQQTSNKTPNPVLRSIVETKKQSVDATCPY